MLTVCHPSIHSTNCDRLPSCFRIGSVWALRVHSLGFSKEQELYKAVVSDNWNIPSAQEVQLQMMDGVCVPEYFLFLFQNMSVKVSCLESLKSVQKGSSRQASVSLQANLKLRRMAGTGGVNQSAFYFSNTCPCEVEAVVMVQSLLLLVAFPGHEADCKCLSHLKLGVGVTCL